MEYKKTRIKPDNFSIISHASMLSLGIDTYRVLSTARDVYFCLKPLFADNFKRLGSGFFLVLTDRNTIDYIYQVAGGTPEQAFIEDFSLFVEPLVGKNIFFVHNRDEFFSPINIQSMPFDSFLRQYLFPIQEDHQFYTNMQQYFPNLECCLVHQTGCLRYLPYEKVDFYLPYVPIYNIEQYRRYLFEYLNQEGFV